MNLLHRISPVIFFLLLFSIPGVFAQSHKLGLIEFYGKGASKELAASCISFHPGDTLKFLDNDTAYTKTTIAIEKCLLKKPGIKQAEISFVCCTPDDNSWITYIGMDSVARKTSSKTFPGSAPLPGYMFIKYDSLLKYVYEAAQSGNSEEDNSAGHSMMKYKPAQHIQEEFITYASNNLAELKEALL